MRYYRVCWTNEEGVKEYSMPLEKWTDAELSRRAIGGDAEVIDYYPAPKRREEPAQNEHRQGTG